MNRSVGAKPLGHGPLSRRLETSAQNLDQTHFFIVVPDAVPCQSPSPEDVEDSGGGWGLVGSFAGRPSASGAIIELTPCLEQSVGGVVSIAPLSYCPPATDDGLYARKDRAHGVGAWPLWPHLSPLFFYHSGSPLFVVVSSFPRGPTNDVSRMKFRQDPLRRAGGGHHPQNRM